ncbi:LuxR C-terminal-related transcriptional regulator [Halomonas sp. HL-93]|uniref:LuxR C-terminal-related transcriptional regulator n=1 Tax=Halomonas sp. HL-93 TaxID=1666906 RepID=UPI0006DB0F11|nr:response regulator transcription factor [Halomonas sp. HL-93]KPQ21317.1 MAG: two component transcriptional regulator, LuxR family [Halomonas sp. HL-93]SBR46571.1 two component transcriptional regulator, LuxR family [Halomonas sp. HL-93]
MYSLLVADDHPLFRDALQVVVSSGLPNSQLLEADSLAAAIPLITEHDGLDLLLLDLSLPDAEGLDGLTRVRETYPWLPVAIISAHQERQLVLDAISLGAVGYIPKSTPREALLNALTQMLEGQLYLPAEVMRRPPTTSPSPQANTPEAAERLAGEQLAQLTDKQLSVLHCMTQGMSNKQIARELSIAETTVKTHVSAILRKLGATSRVHAIVMAGEANLPLYMASRTVR